MKKSFTTIISCIIITITLILSSCSNYKLSGKWKRYEICSYNGDCYQPQDNYEMEFGISGSFNSNIIHNASYETHNNGDKMSFSLTSKDGIYMNTFDITLTNDELHIDEPYYNRVSKFKKIN